MRNHNLEQARIFFFIIFVGIIKLLHEYTARKQVCYSYLLVFSFVNPEKTLKYGMQSTKTTFLIIIQIQSFEKVQLSVVGCSCRSRCYSIFINGSKECHYSLESGLKVLILG